MIARLWLDSDNWKRLSPGFITTDDTNAVRQNEQNGANGMSDIEHVTIEGMELLGEAT